jgi:hypothetical protein
VVASALPVLAARVVVVLLEGASVGAAAVPVAERLVPVVVCRRAVLASVFEVPLLRRAAEVLVLPLLLVPLLLLRFTCAPELLPVVVPVLFPLVLPRRTWVEVLLEGAAVLRVAVLVERVVEVVVL